MRIASLFGFLILLAGIIAAQPTDTVKFSTEQLVFDRVSGQTFIDGLKQISINGRPQLPVYSQYYYQNHSSEIVRPVIEITQADTVFLDFKIQPISNITTSSSATVVPCSTSLGSIQATYPFSASNLIIEKQNEDRLYRLDLFPLQYLSDSVIVLNREIIIRLPSDGSGDLIPGRPDLKDDSKTAYQDNIAASGASTGCPLGCDWLVITSGDLAEEFEAYVELKKRCGFNAAIALTDSIYNYYSGIDNAEAIRNYLMDFYNSGGRYVLLGGDEDNVPVRYAYYYNTDEQPETPYLMMLDHYYADLDGNWDADGDGIWGEPVHDLPDMGAELLVGRLPFSNSEQVAAYREKVTTYLFNPGNGDTEYLTQAGFFCSDQMRDYTDGGQQYSVATAINPQVSSDCETLAEAPTGYDVSPTGPVANDALTGFSDSYGFLNILAHGRPDGFVVNSSGYNDNPKTYILTGSGHIDHAAFEDIEANGKLGFCYTIACEQAAYDLDKIYGMQVPSVTEELLSLPQAGSVGMIAFTRWGWVSSSYLLMTSFYEHLFDDAAGNPVLAMNQSWLDYPYYRDQIYGQNYFGDPSLTLYLDQPGQSAILGDTSFPPGQPFTVRLMHNDQALTGHSVIVSDNNGNCTSYLSDGDGYVTIAASENGVTEINITLFTPGEISQSKDLYPGIAADVDDDLPLPLEFALHQNYPNPFNPTTTIAFSIPRASHTILIIYDILGRKVNEIIDENLEAGEYNYVWNGTDDKGRTLASGIYFSRLRTETDSQIREMVLIK